MRRQTFLVLTALAGSGPLHGYGVVQAIETMTGGSETLSLGSVYGLLDRLEGVGEVRVDSEVVESGRMRRYYEITRAGRESLAAAAHQMEQDARLGRRMLSLDRGETP